MHDGLCVIWNHGVHHFSFWTVGVWAMLEGSVHKIFFCKQKRPCDTQYQRFFLDFGDLEVGAPAAQSFCHWITPPPPAPDPQKIGLPEGIHQKSNRHFAPKPIPPPAPHPHRAGRRRNFSLCGAVVGGVPGKKATELQHLAIWISIRILEHLIRAPNKGGRIVLPSVSKALEKRCWKAIKHF